MTRSFFDAIPEPTRQAVLSTARRRKFKRNEVIFHDGDPGDSLHLVERGHVAVRVTTPLGDVLTLAVLGPGDAFGEQALLNGSRRTATAAAVESAETRVLLAEDYHRLRAEHPQVNELLIDVLAAQVRRLSDHLLEALYTPVDTRVIRRLHTAAIGYTADGDGPIVVPLTQQDLAALAGTTRPTANRVLQTLRDDGIIDLDRGRTTVLDMDRLARAAR